jgi:tetratricopeptide (TPR) repeat protein
MVKDGTSLSVENLNTFKSLLTEAEDHQRSGDSQGIYEAKKNIAVYFQGLKKYDTAVAYFKEALEASGLIHINKDAKIEAAHNLGSVLESLGTKAALMMMEATEI